MMSTDLPQLSYIGMIPQPEHSEYHFRVTSEDRSARRLILAIANSVFLTKQLMIQEAPDLCYQKALAEIRGQVLCDQDVILVTDADIENYRASHPHTKPARRFSRKPA